MNLKVKEYRKRSGMTQQDLGKALKKSFRTIQSWESGLSYPNAEVICDMCDMFGCTPCDMLGWWDDHERPADPSLTPDEDDVLALYRSCTPEKRSFITTTAQVAAQASGEAAPDQLAALSPTSQDCQVTVARKAV